MYCQRLGPRLTESLTSIYTVLLAMIKTLCKQETVKCEILLTVTLEVTAILSKAVNAHNLPINLHCHRFLLQHCMS